MVKRFLIPHFRHSPHLMRGIQNIQILVPGFRREDFWTPAPYLIRGGSDQKSFFQHPGKIFYFKATKLHKA
jgi:hypothetical protein